MSIDEKTTMARLPSLEKNFQISKVKRGLTLDEEYEYFCNRSNKKYIKCKIGIDNKFKKYLNELYTLKPKKRTW
jgi:hypothetical protein